MWQLDNRTPFAAERTWVRDRDGAEIWLTAVKASFTWKANGTLKVADEQPPVTLIPVHHGKPGQSSLRFESDLQRTKLTTDVVVIGQAHTPGERPQRQIDVGLTVGPVVKMLRVFGDRVWHRGAISEAQPFTTMPLVYERAFGGVDMQSEEPAWDTRNPVGQGYASAAKHLEHRPLPNVEYAQQPMRKWNDRPEPAGFGALACHWQARQRFSGTYDARWERERLPLLPHDFDDRHYQFAPGDQQAPQWLRGGEPVVLRNLAPGGGEVRFALPRMYLGFETFFYTGPSVRHDPPRLHAVILEPDASRVSLVWHTALPCHPRVLKLNRTRITLKQDLRDGVLAPPEPSVMEEA